MNHEFGPGDYLIILNEIPSSLIVAVFDHTQAAVNEAGMLQPDLSKGTLGKLEMIAEFPRCQTRCGVFHGLEAAYDFFARYLEENGACEECITDALSSLQADIELTRKDMQRAVAAWN